MTTRILIAIAASACALHASRPRAHAQGADNFIPDQPPKTGADASAEESHSVKYALLLPSEKSSETVKDGERNPFGSSDDGMRDSGGKSTSEETKIQEQLSRLRATGLSPGPTGLRVLLGDMWLTKEDVVPAVIKDQTLALRVNEITRDAIELMWMEKKFTGLPPRLLVIPVDLRATVRRVPHGQLPEKVENKTESPASKRATAVELPVSVVATGNPAESRKAAQAAATPTPARLLPPGSTATSVGSAPATPAAKDVNIITAAPGTLPSLKNTVIPATAAATTQPPGPPSAGDNSDVPPTQDAAKALATQAVPVQKTDETPALPATASPPAEVAAQPASPETTPTVPPPAAEPSSWKRAMGLMENLVKLSEANKK